MRIEKWHPKVPKTLSEAIRLRHTPVLADVSSSMNWPTSSGSRRIDLLRRALELLRPETVVAFSSEAIVVPLSAAMTLEPRGNTQYCRALETLRLTGSCEALLVTDGEPTDPEAAILASARGLRLSAIFCGDPPVPAILTKICGTGLVQSVELISAELLAENMERLLLEGGHSS